MPSIDRSLDKSTRFSPWSKSSYLESTVLAFPGLVSYRYRNVYCSKIGTLFFYFILTIKRCMALYFNTITPDPMHHATPHSSSLTTTSKFPPGVPCPQISTQLNTFGRSWTDVFQAEWTPLQTWESCSRHSSRSGWPSQHITTWSRPGPWDAEQILILEEDGSLICVSPSHKIPTDYTASWMRRLLESSDLTWINCKMKCGEPVSLLLNFWISIKF